LRPFACISLVAVSIVLAGTPVAVGTVETGLLAARLRSAPHKNSDRQAAMLALFRESGCEADRLQERRLGRSKTANVICTVPGTSESTIVVGAHFDHVSAGEGIVDNWSGATLLPAFVSSLNSRPRKHTFVYAAFAEEEAGLVGSDHFARSIPKADRSAVKAMVNIDSVGLGPNALWLSRADKTLGNYAFQTAQSLGLTLDAVNVEKVGDSDSTSFRKLNIPVIDFHSIRQDTLPILHSPRDTFAAINMQNYADSFRLISTFLGLIDQLLE
jgi:Iap family predicted aminopeptidase